MPTLRGWAVGCCGLALLVAAAWFARIDLLFAGLVLALAPLGAMIAVAVDRPWLEVVRFYAPDSVTVGESAQVRLDVRNLASRPTPGLNWRDSLPPELEPVAAGSFPSLEDRIALRYTATARRRGAPLLGPLAVWRTDPFGLVRGGYLVGDSKPLLVTPRVTPLDRGAADEARGEGSDPELVRHSIPSLDEVIPREYRPGDPLRRVQWRATARLDRLMVRQEEQLSNPQARLLLDTVRQHAGDAEPFERAVELAASVAVHLLGLGYLVSVHETGERQLAGAYALPGGDHMLMGRLASVTQSAERDDAFAGRLGAALRADAGGSPAVLVLVDGDPRGWRELAPLRRFAAPAIAFLMTPAAATARESLESAGWLCATPDATTDAAAAWAEATAARDRAARRSAPLAGGPRV